MPNVLWGRLKYILSPQFNIYEKIYPLVHGRVADVGFGTGFGSHLLGMNAEKVIGFEIDEEAVAFASRAFPFLNMSFKYGDITKGIPGKYDFVIMIDVLEHIEEANAALGNIGNMLNDNGVFIMSTPNKHSRYGKSDAHVVEYRPKELFLFLRDFFKYVSLKNYNLEEHTKYDNPIIAFCSNVVIEEN